jgi:tRNA-binding protein
MEPDRAPRRNAVDDRSSDPRQPAAGTPDEVARTGAAATAPAWRPLLPPGSAEWQDFERLDIRVGRVVTAEPFPAARKPAYQLTIDFGPGGVKRSSAQLPGTYPDPAVLVGRLVIAVVNFAPRRIAGFSSEVLVLGALPPDGRIPLLGVDDGASPGDAIG